jgi:hypothetical protein
MKALVVLAAVVAGCGPSLPRGHWDASARRVCAGHVCYDVGRLGASWRMVHFESASAGWFDDSSGAIISTNATCRADTEAAPLAALTRELLVGYTERQIESETLIPLQNREALRSHVRAKLDGVAMELDLVVLRKDGCVFDLAYAAPPASFARGQPDFARFVAGFADARSPHQLAAAAGGAGS